jgi:crotonobetainyl-CoA:carnitine CoA-transferase CaiB-like acyl-CoA transferase
LKVNLAVSPVNNVRQVGNLKSIKKLMVKTVLPNGKEIELFPAPMDTEFLKKRNNVMDMSPSLGAHNDKIFNEAGISNNEVSRDKTK